MSQLSSITPITNGLKAVMKPVFERYTKDELQNIIEKRGGIMTVICTELDCTYSQLWNAIKKYQLEECLKLAKQNLVAKAEESIYQALESENEKIRLEAAEFTLKHMPAYTGGWNTETPQIAIQISNKEKETQIKAIFGLNE